MLRRWTHGSVGDADAVHAARIAEPTVSCASATTAAAIPAATMLVPAAFAGEIGDEAKKLGDASYAFAKEVDGLFLQAPG
eukprot:4552859-Lingulodinium_polyedra.AAC.1